MKINQDMIQNIIGTYLLCSFYIHIIHVKTTVYKIDLKGSCNQNIQVLILI